MTNLSDFAKRVNMVSELSGILTSVVKLKQERDYLAIENASLKKQLKKLKAGAAHSTVKQKGSYILPEDQKTFNKRLNTFISNHGN